MRSRCCCTLGRLIKKEDGVLAIEWKLLLLGFLILAGIVSFCGQPFVVVCVFFAYMYHVCARRELLP